MCAEEKKEENTESKSAKAGCCAENFVGMFEGMKEFCGGKDKASACRERMKDMMSACCGTDAEGTSKKGCC
jgi:hypothetical protein